MGVRNWRSKRTKNSGGQFLKRLRFTKNCNVGRRCRIGMRRGVSRSYYGFKYEGKS